MNTLSPKDSRKVSPRSTNAILFYVFSFLLISNSLVVIDPSSADPIMEDNENGTMTATWAFQDLNNYTFHNLTISPNNVTLQKRIFQFLDTDMEDFREGETFLNVDLTSDPGNMILNDTSSAGTPQTLELRVDQGSGKDAYISGGSGGVRDENYGSSVTLNARLEDEERILIEFDLSYIQDFEWITSSELLLKLESADTTLSMDISANQLTNSWIEGSGDGQQTDDGVTWRTRDGTILWSQQGGDFSVSQEDVVSGIGDQIDWYRWNVTQLVRDWVNGTRPNYGVILVPTNAPPFTGEKRFHSKEGATAGDRPKLRVDYISTEGGVANGTFVSRMLDGQSIVNWGNISWNSILPSQTNLSLQTRSGDCTGNWGDWSQAYNFSSGSRIASPPNRCIQYKVEIKTYNRTKTPVLEEVRIDSWEYVTRGSVETEDLIPGNLVSWDVFNSSFNLPPETNITFFYSADFGSSWTEVFPGETLQFLASPVTRFRANLTTSNTTLTPALFEMNITYVFFGSPDHIHMSLSVWTGTTDEWVDLDAIGHDIFHHETPFTQKWETDDPWGSVNSSGMYLPGMVGTWKVYCNNSDNSISNYTIVNVFPGLTSRIAIDPSDPGALTTDESLLFNATGYDSKGNSLGPVVANWSVTGGVGFISPGPSSFALFNPTRPGFGTVTANDGVGHTNTTNIIQVVVGSRSRVSIEPRSPGTITADECVNFTAYAYDADGNQIGTASVIWSVNGSIGTILPGPSENSTFEATTVGSGDVTINDGLGHANATDLITVVAGVLRSIQVQTNQEVLEHGGYTDFTATGYDSDGNVVAIIDSIWETNAGNITGSTPETATLKAQETELANGWIRVTAILQNNVSGSANVSVVVTNVGPTVLEYWPWYLVAILLAIPILVVFSRRFLAKTHIDDAFLIYRNGSLISHWTAKGETEVDEDILSNMLTAIQNLIQGSLIESEDESANKLEFGKQRIMIEREKNVYLAVVYSGLERKRTLRQMKEAAEEIEKKYSKELENWDGFVHKFSGVEAILGKHLGGSKGDKINEVKGGKRRERGTRKLPKSKKHSSERGPQQMEGPERKLVARDPILQEVPQGYNYLIVDDNPSVAYEKFATVLGKKVPGLCISTTFPDKLRKEFGITEGELYWLSDTSTDIAVKTLDPKRLDFEMTRTIASFFKNSPKGTVMIDGIEYLIVENGFDRVLRFVKRINDLASVNDATVLVTMTPSSLGDDEFALLKKEFDKVHVLTPTPISQ